MTEEQMIRTYSQNKIRHEVPSKTTEIFNSQHLPELLRSRIPFFYCYFSKAVFFFWIYPVQKNEFFNVLREPLSTTLTVKLPKIVKHNR